MRKKIGETWLGDALYEVFVTDDGNGGSGRFPTGKEPRGAITIGLNDDSFAFILSNFVHEIQELEARRMGCFYRKDGPFSWRGVNSRTIMLDHSEFTQMVYSAGMAAEQARPALLKEWEKARRVSRKPKKPKRKAKKK